MFPGMQSFASLDYEELIKTDDDHHHDHDDDHGHHNPHQAADADRDGMVSLVEFDKMMEVATVAQKRLGLPAPFPTPEERNECFKVYYQLMFSSSF